MRGERYQNAIVLILIVLVFASVPLILNLAGIWYLWAPLLVALAVLPSVVLRERDLATGLHGPTQVREALAANLRIIGIATKLQADSVVAPINALSAVRFRTRVSDQGTVLSGQLRATPAGMILLIALVVSVVGSGPAALLGLILFLQAIRFARSQGPAAFREAVGGAKAAGRDEVHDMLAGSLSTALGMSRDALDAQGKAYTDAKAYLVMTAFTVWLAVLVGLFIALNGFNLLTGVWDVPLAGAIGAALVAGAGIFVALRRRFVPRLARYRTWTARLSAAFEDEMSSPDRERPATSTFELLAEASAQVPDWLDAQRKAGLSADPGTAFAVLTLGSFCASMIVNALWAALLGNLSTVPIWATIAALLAGITAWIWYRWRRREDARLAESKHVWDAHIRALRAHMDRFLEEM